MVDIIEKTLIAAPTYDLMTLAELKLKLGVTDSSQDQLLSALLTSYSDVISTMCNRVFAKEKMMETWRNLDSSNRLFLSHYPIATETDILSVECPRGTTMASSGYEVELSSGKVELYQTQNEPITITYSGGYVLPGAAPPALKEALSLLIQDERYRAARSNPATAGMRSLVHKETRVVFFDPNAAAKGGMTTFNPAMGGITGTVNALLMHYVRVWV